MSCQSVANLSNLIWFGMGALALEVEPLPHAGPGKNVVTALCPHPEAFRLKQMAKLLEADIGI